MKSLNVGRLVAYISVLVALLALPFLISFALLRVLPDRYIVAPAYLAADGGTFNLDAFKSISSFANVERLVVADHADHIMAAHAGDLVRFVILKAEVSALAVAEKMDQEARTLKGRNGFTVAGKESSRAGRRGQLLTRFSDGSVALTAIEGATVLQVISRDPERSADYFQGIGIVVENQAISDWRAWCAKNFVGVIILLNAIFAGGLLVWIFKGGCWVAEVAPRPNTPPVSAAELKRRLLAINDLEVPLRLSSPGGDALNAEWRAEGKWRGLLEEQSVRIVANLGLKLHADRRAVSVIETQRKWNCETGRFGGTAEFAFFRGITLVSYDAGTVYGLSYGSDGFKVTGYSYRFSAQEMKNPLIEAVTAAGWRWEPHVFSH